MFIMCFTALADETTLANSEQNAHTCFQVAHHKTSDIVLIGCCLSLRLSCAPVFGKWRKWRWGKQQPRRKWARGQREVYWSLCFSKGGDSFKVGKNLWLVLKKERLEGNIRISR